MNKFKIFKLIVGVMLGLSASHDAMAVSSCYSPTVISFLSSGNGAGNFNSGQVGYLIGGATGAYVVACDKVSSSNLSCFNVALAFPNQGCSPMPGDSIASGICHIGITNGGNYNGMTYNPINPGNSVNPANQQNSYNYPNTIPYHLSLGVPSAFAKCIAKYNNNCSSNGASYDYCDNGTSPATGAIGGTCYCKNRPTCPGGYNGQPCWGPANICTISAQTYNSATNTCSCPAGGPPLNSAGNNCACDSGLVWNGSTCAAPATPTPAPCAPQVCNKSTTVAASNFPIDCKYTCAASGASASGSALAVPGGNGGGANFQITSGTCMDTANLVASGKVCSPGRTLTGDSCFFVEGNCTPQTAPASTCAAGQTGVFPVCCTAPQTYNGSACVDPAPAQTCAAGQTGVYPVCCTAPQTYNGSACVNTDCPSGQTGAYPVCCTALQTYNGSTCVNTDCPAGQTGAYPICCTSLQNFTGTSCVNKTCADTGEVGTYPKCCPPGKTWDSGTGSCVNSNILCPPQYSVWSSGGNQYCRANLPSDRFYYAEGPAGATALYPICGPKRVAVNTDYRWMNISTSEKPNSNLTQIYSGTTLTHAYKYGGSSDPETISYMYRDTPHCACHSTSVAYTSAATANALPGLNASRSNPDHAAIITTQTSAANMVYGMVAIDQDETKDGRLGTRFEAGNSSCGCPNINERVSGGSSTSGPRCIPAFNDSKRILATYDPAVHDSTLHTQVMNRSSEVIVAGKVIGSIRLPVSDADLNTTISYKRKIWTCAAPYTLNVSSSGVCEFLPERHACDVGNPGNGIPASEVSSDVTGVSGTARFNNTMNKKLACCLNRYNTSANYEKFDCIENSKKKYTGFDQLWQSADSVAEGAQMNALLLTNSLGRPLTGFYTLNGVRCEEFTDFGGSIQSYKVNPGIGVTAQMNTANGSANPNAIETLPYLIAAPTSTGYTAIKNYYSAKGVALPTTAVQMRRCPVLVRAAAMVQCPPNTSATQRTLETVDGSGNVTGRRCSNASSVQVQVRVEQVYEIAGMPKLQPVDTIIDSKNASAISIDRIIANKYGNQCPPGTTRQGDACVD